MKIEKMTAAHLDGVCKIENDCFVHPWSRESLESELQNDNSLFYVAAEDDKVIGYIGMNFVLDEGYISNVAVDPEARRRGIGRALVKEMLRRAAERSLAFVTLEVRAHNDGAIALYAGEGFLPAGRRKDYYERPKEDALLMTRFF